MTTPFSLGIPIPSLLWSSLEDVLNTNMRLFAKDIAKTLGKSETLLLQALSAEKICPYIFEPSEEVHEIDMRCSVCCTKPESPFFLQPCGNPIVWNSSTKKCMEHLAHKDGHVPTLLPSLKRLEHTIDENPIYVSEDSTVYTADNTPIGVYTDGRLVLFVEEGAHE
jgi:hypothetical protein